MSEEKSTPSRKKGKGRVVNARVAVTKETMLRISEFAKGVGLTQDEALSFIFDKLIGDKNPMQAGLDLRGEAGHWKYRDDEDDEEES